MWINAEEVSGAAAEVLDSSVDVNVAWQDAAPGLYAVTSDVAGDTPGGPKLMDAHATLVEAGGTAIETMSGLLEVVAEAMFSCVFAISSEDDATAQKFKVS